MARKYRSIGRIALGGRGRRSPFGPPGGFYHPGIPGARPLSPYDRTGGMPGMGQAATPPPQGGGGIGTRVWNWVKDNPELATAMLGTAANVYGAYQSGQAMDRQADIAEDRLALAQEAQERRFSEQEEQKRRNTEVLRRMMAAEEEARRRRRGRNRTIDQYLDY